MHVTTTPFHTYKDRIVVDVWSDIMCPFCYIGDSLLAQAAEQVDQPVEVRYHSYQLMPDLPHGTTTDLGEMLEKERGLPRAQADAMNQQVAARAAQIGLTYNMDIALATNTHKAHRLIHFAKAQGRQHDMVMRLFQAYFTDGLHTGDDDVLADLAAEIGLDRDEALTSVTSDTHDEDFHNDIRLAHQLGITGVPFFVIDGKYAISGAQPVETFTQALNTAWQQHATS